MMWLIGGQVFGRWLGLAADALHDGRDLAVTTDFREVLSALARQHLGLSEDAVAAVFRTSRAVNRCS